MLLQEISQILAAIEEHLASQEEKLIAISHIYIQGSDRRETIP
jgi:hypothetical protein